jgi:hypothetical protein
MHSMQLKDLMKYFFVEEPSRAYTRYRCCAGEVDPGQRTEFFSCAYNCERIDDQRQNDKQKKDDSRRRYIAAIVDDIHDLSVAVDTCYDACIPKAL